MIAKKTTLALAIVLFLSSGAHAADRADNEKLGSTSSDTTEIKLTVKGGDGITPPNPGGSILIQNLNNITFEDFGANGAGDLSKGSTFCVYRTGGGTGAIGYNLTPLSANSGLKSGNTTIGYTMSYNDNAGGNNANLVFDTKAPVKTTANGTLTKDGDTYKCTGENGLLTITATFADVAAAPAGEYKDTLTLLVEPI